MKYTSRIISILEYELQARQVVEKVVHEVEYQDNGCFQILGQAYQLDLSRIWYVDGDDDVLLVELY